MRISDQREHAYWLYGDEENQLEISPAPIDCICRQAGGRRLA